LITVLREGLSSLVRSGSVLIIRFVPGMEAVVFVGGVSLGQPATSIPIATIVGLLCGLIIGFLIYSFASRTSALSFPLRLIYFS
jgi:NhaP-type Na+/H+ or K+/H+ antiporter